MDTESTAQISKIEEISNSVANLHFKIESMVNQIRAADNLYEAIRNGPVDNLRAALKNYRDIRGWLD